MSKPLPTPEFVASLTVMNTDEAAIYLRMSKAGLSNYRMKGGGPLYIKHTQRKVLYRRSDLDAWLALRVFDSTSAEAATGFQS